MQTIFSGKYITKIELTDVEFKPNLEADHFKLPADAELLKDL